MSTTDLDRQLHASVMTREAVKEAEYREKRMKEEEEAQLGFGATEMTPAELRKIIDSDRRTYYRTEELNDKLYIHYKGWRQIQGLEGWTGLKVLYAECNAFSRIQGLQNCRSLRSLFLQENCIHRIEGLENCPDLWNINLSNNFIESIEGLSHLRKLNTLTIAKNKLGMKGVEDLAELADTTVTSLDVQDNLIWDPDVLPEVFMRMTELRVLYLKGNACTKQIPNYRKSITVCCEDLRYLDDRPVFAEDRRAADAFNRGGLEEERAERRRIREENSVKHEKNMQAFNDMIAKARAEKRERDAMRLEDKFTEETDPVETQEKRMKRQVDKWKEENADDLKDDAKEHAERCLRQEQERGAGADVGARDESTKAADEGTTDADATEAEDTDVVKEPEKEASDKPKVKVDNRKLVYEDIWDDVPPLATPASKPPTAAAPPAVAPPSAPARGPPAAAPATSEIFLPWATGEGIAGMESVAPASSVVERRAAELQAAKQQPPPQQQQRPDKAAQDDAGKGPAWYSKYAEKSQAKQEVLSTPAPTMPPTRTSEAEPAPASELDEMD